jgi:hypothetical protein
VRNPALHVLLDITKEDNLKVCKGAKRRPLCFNYSNKANRFISSNNQIWGTAQTPRATFGVEDSLSSAYVPRTFQLGARIEF